MLISVKVFAVENPISNLSLVNIRWNTGKIAELLDVRIYKSRFLTIHPTEIWVQKQNMKIGAYIIFIFLSQW